MDEDFEHYMTWYLDIRRRNTFGQRFEPIDHQKMETFGRIFGIDLEPFDYDIMSSLDDLWMASQPAPEASGHSPRRSIIPPRSR